MMRLLFLPLHLILNILFSQYILRIYATRELNPHSKFLYNSPYANPYITDYQIHLAPSADYSGPQQEEHAKRPPGQNDEERHVRPSFLKPRPHKNNYHDIDDNYDDSHHGNRVVQFYSPWSGQCQDYVTNFVEISKTINLNDHVCSSMNNNEIKDGNDDSKYENIEKVKFFTISCSAHHWVCEDNYIKSYPTIAAYRKNSIEPIPLNWETLNAGTLCDIFRPKEKKSKKISKSKKIHPVAKEEEKHDYSELKEREKEVIFKEKSDDNKIETLLSPITDNMKEYEAIEIKPHATLHILEASTHVYKRVRKDTYADAAVSFTYALRHDIFPPVSSSTSLCSQASSSESIEYKELTEEQKSAFMEWIDLLYWALPPNWRLHTLINDIRNNFDSVLKSKQNMIELVDLHHEVVHEGNNNILPSKKDKKAMTHQHAHASHWSPACAKPENHYRIQTGSSPTKTSSCPPIGYTCGLWNLIHVISIGVAERQAAVLGARNRASVGHAMHTMYQYLHHFTHSLGNEYLLGKQGRDSIHDSSKKRSKSSPSKWNEVTGDMISSSIVFLKEEMSKCINHPFHHCAELYPPTTTAQKGKKSKKSAKSNNDENEHRKQMALHLWKIHNQHNVNLAMKQGYTPLSFEEEREVMWPNKDLCDSCYQWKKKKGSWDLEGVFDFLKSEYWPSGVHNFRYVVLNERSTPIYEPPRRSYLHYLFHMKWNRNSFVLFCFMIFIMGCLGFRLSTICRNIYIHKTGRHKKSESEYVLL